MSEVGTTPLHILFTTNLILDLVWELHVTNNFPSVWKPANAFRLSKHVSEAPAANSLPPNCEAHFVTWSGEKEGEVHANLRTMLPQSVRATKEPRELV